MTDLLKMARPWTKVIDSKMQLDVGLTVLRCADDLDMGERGEEKKSRINERYLFFNLKHLYIILY